MLFRFAAVTFVILSGFFPCVAFAWDNFVGSSREGRIVAVNKNNLLEASENGRDIIAIRLYGVGIPTLKQPFGKEAHDLLLKLFPKDQRIIFTPVREDEDGSVLALVQVSDRSVNNRLIMEGLGWVDRYVCKAFFCRRWHIAEHMAQKEKLGVWSLNVSTPPWQWGELE